MSRGLATVISGLLLGIVMLFNSCQSGVFKPAQGTSTLGNPLHSKTSFAVSQYSDISELKICVSQMVLMTVSGEQVTLPSPSPAEQTIPMNGTDLLELLVPSGQYTKIDLVLADVCGSSESLALVNSQGTFNTSSLIALEFAGNEFVGSQPQKIVFDFQALAAALSGAQSNASVATLASNTQGLYHSASCGMQTNLTSAAFCETFDQAYSATSRAGQLNSRIWSVARTGSSNQGQGMYDTWNPTIIDACGSLQTAQPDGTDVLVCNGQMREASNDGANLNGATSLTMSPRQAFDFAGRTGTVAFDVTNDTTGSSGVWPEFWLTEQSAQGSWNFNGIQQLPKNGIALRFSGSLAPGNGGVAPNCPSDSNERWILSEVTIVQNYVAQTAAWSWSDTNFQTLGCVIGSDGSSGKMNHIELKIAQNRIEVWATDAGSPQLKQIATLKGMTLPFTRGYITLSDNHNSARQSHTFAWDNVAFDGPIVKRDLGFDVLDALTPYTGGLLNLGWEADPATPASMVTVNVSAQDIAAANATGLGATLTFNYVTWDTNLTTMKYTINGNAFSSPIPYTAAPYSMHTIEVPVPASALVTGPQNIAVSSDDGIFILYNVSINFPSAGQ